MIAPRKFENVLNQQLHFLATVAELGLASKRSDWRNFVNEEYNFPGRRKFPGPNLGQRGLVHGHFASISVHDGTLSIPPKGPQERYQQHLPRIQGNAPG